MSQKYSKKANRNKWSNRNENKFMKQLRNEKRKPLKEKEATKRLRESLYGKRSKKTFSSELLLNFFDITRDSNGNIVSYTKKYGYSNLIRVYKKRNKI
jgi:ribosomal protein S4